jgi:hypothetical protein
MLYFKASNFMANNFRGNDALGEMNFLGNVIREIVIRGTITHTKCQKRAFLRPF